MHTLAVIIISYNTRDLLRACLRSVLTSAQVSADTLQVEVLVVDNASQDGSAVLVRQDFPQVRLVALNENRGFTGGNNLALRLLGFNDAQPPTSISALPDFVLLLNPDTEVIGDALATLVQTLIAHPQAGICGANLRYGDGTFQHGAFHFPSLFQVLLDFFPLVRVPGTQRLHNSRWNGRYPAALWQGQQAFAVDFVLGAALLARGAAIRQAGLLDEGYFMYCEEIDWCLRFHDAGWQVLAAPTALITHHEGRSSRQVRWAAFERLWRSRFRFYAKYPQHYSTSYRWLVRQLARVGVLYRRRLAQRRFARGEITPEQFQAELVAYRAILRMDDRR